MDTKHLIISQVIKCSECRTLVPTNLYSNYFSFEVSARLTEQIKRYCEQIHHAESMSVCGICGDEITCSSMHITPAAEVDPELEKGEGQDFAFLSVHPKCVGIKSEILS